MEFYTCVEQHRNYIYYRGYDHHGNPVKGKDKFRPSLFFPTASPSSWKTIQGTSVEKYTYPSISDAYKSIKNISTFYGNKKWKYQWIQEEFPGDISWDRKNIHVGNIDIEVIADEFPNPENAKWPISSITVYSSKWKKYFVFTTDPLKYDKTKTELDIDPSDIVHVHTMKEESLLRAFVKGWDALAPDVITGWYTNSFDIPYLINRIRHILGEAEMKKLSPFRIVESYVKKIDGRETTQYNILGVCQLDYLELFKKFGYIYGTQETYRLDHIAYVVLGERKLSYDEFDGLNDLYKKDPQKYVDYNTKDVQLVQRIDEKCDFITLAFEVAYKSGTNAVDTLGTIVVWDTMIYRDLLSKGIVVPQPKEHVNTKYDGAFVKPPVVGLHNWIVSFDLNSLYPSLIVQLNMSPETIVGMDNTVSVESYLEGKHDFNGSPHCVAANGACFKKTQRGAIPRMVSDIYDERVQIKKEIKALIKSGVSKEDDKIKMLGNKQQAIKILLNSLYGAIGSAWFRWYDLRIAEAITHTGQVAIQWSEKQINDYLKRDAVVAIDTDSNYVALGSSVTSIDEAEALADKLEKVIDQGYNDLAQVTNSFENRMVMKREVIADRGLWTAKKRYILQVLDDEGDRLSEPKIKVTGIESVRSSTPEVCRDWFKEFFKIILNEDEETVRKSFLSYKKKFKELAVEEVAQNTSVNKLDVYHHPKTVYIPGSGAPMQVKAALNFNHLVKKEGLDNKYDTIKNGDKIKMVRLKKPNPTGLSIIGFPNVLPREFDLEDYIDYEDQFTKVFAKPIKTILDTIGYSLTERNAIYDFFQ